MLNETPPDFMIFWFGFILGALAGLIGLQCCKVIAILSTIHFDRRKKRKDIRKTIQQLEDHVNE